MVLPRVILRPRPVAAAPVQVSSGDGAKGSETVVQPMAPALAKLPDSMFRDLVYDTSAFKSGLVPSDLRALLCNVLDPSVAAAAAIAGQVVQTKTTTTTTGSPNDICRNWKQLVATESIWKALYASHALLRLVYEQDVGGEGDCGFHCLAAGFNERFYGAGQDPEHSLGVMQVKDMRDCAAAALSSEHLREFVEHSERVQAIHLPDDFKRHSPITQLKLVRDAIRQPGSFWMTEETLVLLLNHPMFKRLQLGFALVSAEMRDFTRPTTEAEQKIHPHIKRVVRSRLPVLTINPIRTRETRHLMFMRNLGRNHWRLLSLFPHDGATNMSTCWPIDSLPIALYDFMRQDRLP